MPTSEAIVVRGSARPAGSGTAAADATATLDEVGFSLVVGSARPIRAAYRDLSLVAIQQGSALLVLGDGADRAAWLLERFGDRLGPLVRELRERRLRQRLTDGLAQLPHEPAELLEFAWTPAPPDSGSAAGGGVPGAEGAASGVGQLVVHAWGFVMAPLDERLAWVRYRRAAIAEVTLPDAGAVRVDGEPGRLELRGVGAAALRLRDRLNELRDGAFADAERFLETLLPDAPFAVRRRAGELLVDGRPVRPDELGEGWSIVEAATLTEPTFAESYQALVTTAGAGAPRWLAMAPAEPGAEEAKIWFLVGLPGNLVALELVSAGAHATYCFRVVPRPAYAGESAAQLGEACGVAVRDVSEALVDARFLREPMALPAAQLGLPANLRYRLALAALPSLAAARSRFVARVVHRDPGSWASAMQDLVRWHGGCRDDAAEWPGRAAQEAQVAEAVGADDSEAFPSESAQGDAPEAAADESSPSSQSH